MSPPRARSTTPVRTYNLRHTPARAAQETASQPLPTRAARGRARGRSAPKTLTHTTTFPERITPPNTSNQSSESSSDSPNTSPPTEVDESTLAIVPVPKITTIALPQLSEIAETYQAPWKRIFGTTGEQQATRHNTQLPIATTNENQQTNTNQLDRLELQNQPPSRTNQTQPITQTQTNITAPTNKANTNHTTTTNSNNQSFNYNSTTISQPTHTIHSPTTITYHIYNEATTNSHDNHTPQNKSAPPDAASTMLDQSNPDTTHKEKGVVPLIDVTPLLEIASPPTHTPRHPPPPAASPIAIPADTPIMWQSPLTRPQSRAITEVPPFEREAVGMLATTPQSRGTDTMSPSNNHNITTETMEINTPPGLTTTLAQNNQHRIITPTPTEHVTPSLSHGSDTSSEANNIEEILPINHSPSLPRRGGPLTRCATPPPALKYPKYIEAIRESNRRSHVDMRRPSESDPELTGLEPDDIWAETFTNHMQDTITRIKLLLHKHCGHHVTSLVAQFMAAIPILLANPLLFLIQRYARGGKHITTPATTIYAELFPQLISVAMAIVAVIRLIISQAILSPLNYYIPLNQWSATIPVVIERLRTGITNTINCLEPLYQRFTRQNEPTSIAQASLFLNRVIDREFEQMSRFQEQLQQQRQAYQEQLMQTNQHGGQEEISIPLTLRVQATIHHPRMNTEAQAVTVTELYDVFYHPEQATVFTNFYQPQYTVGSIQLNNILRMMHHSFLARDLTPIPLPTYTASIQLLDTTPDTNTRGIPSHINAHQLMPASPSPSTTFTGSRRTSSRQYLHHQQERNHATPVIDIDPPPGLQRIPTETHNNQSVSDTLTQPIQGQIARVVETNLQPTQQRLSEMQEQMTQIHKCLEQHTSALERQIAQRNSAVTFRADEEGDMTPRRPSRRSLMRTDSHRPSRTSGMSYEDKETDAEIAMAAHRLTQDRIQEESLIKKEETNKNTQTNPEQWADKVANAVTQRQLPKPLDIERFLNNPKPPTLTEQDMEQFARKPQERLTETEVRAFADQLEQYLTFDTTNTELMEEARALRKLTQYTAWRVLGQWLQLYANPTTTFTYHKKTYWRKKYDDNAHRCMPQIPRKPELTDVLDRFAKCMETQTEQRDQFRSRNNSNFRPRTSNEGTSSSFRYNQDTNFRSPNQNHYTSQYRSRQNENTPAYVRDETRNTQNTRDHQSTNISPYQQSRPNDYQSRPYSYERSRYNSNNQQQQRNGQRTFNDNRNYQQSRQTNHSNNPSNNTNAIQADIDAITGATPDPNSSEAETPYFNAHSEAEEHFHEPGVSPSHLLHLGL